MKSCVNAQGKTNHLATTTANKIYKRVPQCRTKEIFNLDKVAIFLSSNTYRPRHSVEQIQLGHNGLFCAFSIVCVYLGWTKWWPFWWCPMECQIYLHSCFLFRTQFMVWTQRKSSKLVEYKKERQIDRKNWLYWISCRSIKKGFSYAS